VRRATSDTLSNAEFQLPLAPSVGVHCGKQSNAFLESDVADDHVVDVLHQQVDASIFACRPRPTIVVFGPTRTWILAAWVDSERCARPPAGR